MSREDDARRTPAELLADRIDRYLDGEPLRVIAADHGITIGGLCNCVKRHAPNVAGSRPRGGRPRWEREA